MRQVLSSLVCGGVAVKKVTDEVEVDEAGMMKSVLGERQEEAGGRHVHAAGQPGLENNDCELFSLGCLVCKLLESILAKVVRSQFKGELEILNRNTFIQAMEAVVNLLCKREGKVSTALECLAVLVQVGHSLGQR